MAAVKLHHRVTGQGEPLVLLHGLFGSQENLGGIARLLADDYQIHGLDLRNHGRSPHTDSHNYELMAQDVLAYLDQADLQQAVVLGHSMGGKVAMQLALNHPDRVARLVVADIAPVRYPPHHQQIMQGLQQLTLTALPSREVADRQLAEYVTELSVRQFLLKNLVKDGPNSFRWRLNLDALSRHYDCVMQGQDATQAYPGPTLFLKGGQSDYIQKAHWPQIQRLFPNAILRIISGTGHWLHADKPEIVAAVVRRFLQAQAPTLTAAFESDS